MLRIISSAGLVLALSTAAFAQAPPAPPNAGQGASSTTGIANGAATHSMSSTHGTSTMGGTHSMGKGTMGKTGTMHKGAMKSTVGRGNSMGSSSTKGVMRTNQLNGTTPAGAPPAHTP